MAQRRQDTAPEPDEQRAAWEKAYARQGERDEPFTTVSGAPVQPLYTPDDVAGLDYARDLGYPGFYPYTRGVQPTMYRGRPWTTRLFSGMGTAPQANERFKFLLAHGQTGLSTAYDYPTLMGYDSDHPRSEGEVGVCGTAMDSVDDMVTLFDGIPLDEVSVSMTINGPAPIVFGLFLAGAERQGAPFEALRGTVQADILKEYIAQKSWLIPPEPSMRLITDMLAYCCDHVPNWNTISISGYHIREAGSTAVQELAFTLADGFAYVEAGQAAGLDVDQFAPRLSFFFNAHSDFLEEIAKYRAARRIWARHMRERYGAKDPRSWAMRFHTQTAGCSLTAQQPENNIVRTAIQALGAVLGGTQSLHTNSMDEVYALPTDHAAKIALRTQQIIAEESGVTNTIDPFAGSYAIEALTNAMEAGAEAYFEQIEKLGGVLKAIEMGYFQREIHEAARRYQQEIEQGTRVIVGLNKYVEDDEVVRIPLQQSNVDCSDVQRGRVERWRESRDNIAVTNRLADLAAGCTNGGNLMQQLVECSRVGATEGEMADVFRAQFGTWTEPDIF